VFSVPSDDELLYQPVNIISLHVIFQQQHLSTNEEHADEAYAMWPDKVLGPTAMESGRKVHCACRVPGHAKAETMQLITAFSMIGNV